MELNNIKGYISTVIVVMEDVRTRIFIQPVMITAEDTNSATEKILMGLRDDEKISSVDLKTLILRELSDEEMVACINVGLLSSSKTLTEVAAITYESLISNHFEDIMDDTNYGEDEELEDCSKCDATDCLHRREDFVAGDVNSDVKESLIDVIRGLELQDGQTIKVRFVD